MRKLFIILLLLPLSLKAQSHWEISLGGEYMLTAYSFKSPHNTWGTGLQATMWYEPFGIKLDLGITPQSICGNRIGAAFMIRTPLNPWLAADIGLGLASYSKPRYVTQDTNNVYISTPVVCLFDLGLVAQIDERGGFLAFRLLHSSNGNMRRPNRGLNFFRVEMGIPLSNRQTRSFSYRPPYNSSRFVLPTHHYLDIMFVPSLSFSRHNMQRGVFFCYDVALSYEYRRTRSFGYGGTLDLWYNFSHPWQLPRYHDPYTFPMYVSALAYFEHFWGPVSLRSGIGVVLAASSRVMVPVYERLGVYYNFGNNYAGIGINAHGGQAEFIEWSYGRRIPLSKKHFQ